jgi:hypothetical protein
MIDIYCKGMKKKIGIPCRRFLGRAEGKADFFCPLCKTWNIVRNGIITVKVNE